MSASNFLKFAPKIRKCSISNSIFWPRDTNFYFANFKSFSRFVMTREMNDFFEIIFQAHRKMMRNISNLDSS